MGSQLRKTFQTTENIRRTGSQSMPQLMPQSNLPCKLE